MKKVLSIIFASLMVSALISGCKNTPPEQNPGRSDDDQSSVSSVTQDSEKTDDSQAQSSDAPNGDDSGAESSEEKESSAAQDSEPEVSSDVSSASGNKTVDISDVNVRPADWTVVEWENYSNQYFTLTIPKGWQVQWQGDANRLEWMATAPDLTVGMYNIDHDYASKDASMMQALGMNMSLQDGTVEEYFKTKFAASTEYFNIQNSCVPANKEFIQSLTCIVRSDGYRPHINPSFSGALSEHRCGLKGYSYHIRKGVLSFICRAGFACDRTIRDSADTKCILSASGSIKV